MRATSWTPSIEWPPSMKKLSSRPTDGLPSRAATSAATRGSIAGPSPPAAAGETGAAAGAGAGSGNRLSAAGRGQGGLVELPVGRHRQRGDHHVAGRDHVVRQPGGEERPQVAGVEAGLGPRTT